MSTPITNKEPRREPATTSGAGNGKPPAASCSDPEVGRRHQPEVGDGEAARRSAAAPHGPPPPPPGAPTPRHRGAPRPPHRALPRRGGVFDHRRPIPLGDRPDQPPADPVAFASRCQALRRRGRQLGDHRGGDGNGIGPLVIPPTASVAGSSTSNTARPTRTAPSPSGWCGARQVPIGHDPRAQRESSPSDQGVDAEVVYEVG